MYKRRRTSIWLIGIPERESGGNGVEGSSKGTTEEKNLRTERHQSLGWKNP